MATLFIIIWVGFGLQGLRLLLEDHPLDYSQTQQVLLFIGFLIMALCMGPFFWLFVRAER